VLKSAEVFQWGPVQ
jgi:hypothetical protein